MLTGRRIVLAVTGGIAAYKAAEVCSRLTADGADVRVVMTAAAQRFIAPLTFRALSGHPVVTDLWGEVEPRGVVHVRLADFAELLLVAPATANIIGKMARGIADEVVSTLALSVDVPVVLAPAMNARMWRHPAVRENIAILRARGVRVVGPEEGRLACGVVGVGRLAETERILAAVREALAGRPSEPEREASS